MIRLNGVYKEIKGKNVLNNINYTFEEGNLYLLKGHNGCGKTMMLRMLCGLIRPSSGTVEIDEGYDYGVLIENPTFMENETGFYNLKYLASIKNEIQKEQIEAMLNHFNLGEVSKKKVKSYSLGMKQRLGIVQALMENPKVILLDEPFNALDEVNFKLVFEYLKNERGRGKIIVIAAHALEEKYMEEFDKIILMDNGSIIC